VRALCILTVSDLVTGTESARISDDELKVGVDAMMRVACRVAVADLPDGR
jgi:purine-nucleoside phosphorylase